MPDAQEHILTVHTGGRTDQIQVGIRGIVGALYLTDLAHKVRRGAAGNIREGKHAGGLAYGYNVTPGKPGEWTINPAQGAIVRRIFAEYIAGERTPAIKARLNADGIKPPRGKYWQPGALTGSNNRHNGILGNEIYCGRLVWNRVRMIKDPETGKRVSRPNPEAEWQRVDVPQLAIISREIFDEAAKIRGSRRHAAPALRRRPKALLSGLLRCGACGAGMSIKGADRGGTRVVCTAHHNAKACANSRTYYLRTIEQTVLSGLQVHLSDPRAIRHFLKSRGASRGRIERLMRRHGIRAIMARPRRVRTTDSRHDFPIAPNLLERNFIAAAPNRIWLADITYVETDQGWLYLATVMDLYSRKIVGWAMADHLRAELPLAALVMAIATQRPSAGLIHHSDRGVQYASAEYRKMMQSAGFRASMSRRADCYDNAPMESFFHTLKTELVHHQHYATREEARRDIFAYIEGFTIERVATRPSDISARSRWS